MTIDRLTQVGTGAAAKACGTVSHSSETIDRLTQVGTGAGLRPIQFRLFRGKAGDDGGARLRGLFRLRFPTPVAGPIALGHSCHFGLGLFVASEGLEMT